MDPVTIASIASAIFGAKNAKDSSQAAQQQGAQQSLASAIGPMGVQTPEISPVQQLWQQFQSGQGMRF